MLFCFFRLLPEFLRQQRDVLTLVLIYNFPIRLGGGGVVCLPGEGAFFFLAAPREEEQEGCQCL